MDTKKISVMPVDAKTFADRQDIKLRRVVNAACAQQVESFAPLYDEFKARFAADEWIFMTNKDVCYINDIVAIMPNLPNFDSAIAQDNRTYSVSPARWKFAGFNGDLMTDS